MTAGRIAAVVLAALVVMVLGAPLWCALLGIDPHAISPVGPNHPPQWRHWLGTDGVGRDVLARVLYGARTSFAVATAAAVVAAAVGGAAGAFAGFVGGWIDELVVRATEATMAVPKLPLLLLLSVVQVPAGAVGRLAFLVGLLALMAWPAPARIARASAMQCRQSGYVLAAEAIGATTWWTWRWHVLPRTVPVVAVGAAGDVAELILLESLLSYLGFGIPEPSPSLGNLLSGGLPLLLEAPIRIIVPGLLTVAAVASLHALADRWAVHIDPYRFSPERGGPANVRLRNE